MKYPEIKLGEVADIKGGKRLPKGEVLVDYDTGFPYIRAQDIKNGLIAFKEPKFITYELRQKLKNYTVNKDDVCITIVGAYVGDIGIVNNSLSGANLTENAVKLTNLKNNFDAQYLKYCLLTREAQEAMKKFGSGAAQDKLGIYKIKEIQIPNPPAEIQRKIAGILSGYDRLIENNTRRIEILEEMARSIYREWFVNFRFPGHEQVRMVDSELGLIPEGWEAKKIKDVMELAYGKSLIAKNRIPGTVPVYGSAGVIGYHNESLAKSPGVIIGRKGNIGSVFWSDDDFFPIDTVFYVQTEVCLHYIYYNLQNQNFINNDAAVPGLNRNQAYSLPFLLPRENLLKQFQHFVDVIFKQTRNLRIKNDNLRSTRDLLLPRLISGEIDVENLDINTSQIAA